MDKNKIQRFEQALEKSNPSRQLALFWNEVEQEITKEQPYIDEIEWTNLQLQLHHNQFNKILVDSFRVKMMGRNAILQTRQYRRLNNGN